MGNLKFYKDEPLFGLDIGHASLKAMQIQKNSGKPPSVLGYGMGTYEPGAILNGVIVKPEAIAESMRNIFESGLVGTISSQRVACSLPTAYTFSRPMNLPIMNHEDILEAVSLEAEQYIPIPIDNLYLDYEILFQDQQKMGLLLVAASKSIVDSYLKLLQMLKLEPVAMEPSINAASRLLQLGTNFVNKPAILIDIGSVTTDIAIFDKTLLVASTVNNGGDSVTNQISKSFRIGWDQAAELKNKYGIAFSDRQQRIVDAIKPLLDDLIHEIQKSVRYFSEQQNLSGQQISQLVTVGGGSIMPGLNQYLSKELRLPTQNLDPWPSLDFGSLTMPSEIDRSVYIISAGEALLDPKEVVK